LGSLKVVKLHLVSGNFPRQSCTLTGGQQRCGFLQQVLKTELVHPIMKPLNPKMGITPILQRNQIFQINMPELPMKG
jgi:hypothetical protein